jgi:hypothetical protein
MNKELIDYLKNPSEDVDSLTETVSYIFETLTCSSYQALHLDALLEQDLSQANAVHVAAMVRALNFQKTLIPQWSLLLKKAYDLCLEQHYDVHDVLYGFEKDLQLLS